MSSIANEIEQIIARAMEEYANAKGGINPFDSDVSSVSASTNSSLPWDDDPVVENEHKEIPVNSKSILVEEKTSRFSDAEWFEEIKKQTVCLAGLGGIGSYVAFLLARLDVNFMILYDGDVVEAVNMSGQLYNRNDIGSFKTAAIGRCIQDYASFHKFSCNHERFTRESSGQDIMICGFDNMEARRIYYNVWRNRVNSLPPERRADCLFIDGRLAAEEFQVFCILGTDKYNMERYEKEFLFHDSEAEETLCSYKQTTFMANMIGSIMVNLFVNFCANRCNPLIPRDLPFYTSYTANTMFFKTVA